MCGETRNKIPTVSREGVGEKSENWHGGGKYHIITIGTKPNDTLAYAIFTKKYHTNMSTLEGHG